MAVESIFCVYNSLDKKTTTTVPEIAAMAAIFAISAMKLLTAMTVIGGRQQPSQDIFHSVTINLVWLVAKVQTRSVYNVKRLCGER